MEARIDKFLWSVRIYKTRSIAAEAIKKGRITMGGTQVKASRIVKIGDVVSVRVPPATRSFSIIDIPRSRVGAKLVPNYITEVTPQDQLEIIELQRLASTMNRQKGLGRPTKKDRRDIDSFFGDQTDDFEPDFDFGDDSDDIDDFDEGLEK
ncbi:MAG: RNA-binding S4 domain-containing protein [Marinilabiliaceae bacterium]|nr:RNA-binding S4 domain-containing protein [Marinilabiliaceae bacterium]